MTTTTTHPTWCDDPDPASGPFAYHETHFSVAQDVPASLYPGREERGRIVPDRFTIYVQQETSGEPEVHLGRGDLAGFVMTADEARQVAAALVTMADRIEGAL